MAKPSSLVVIRFQICIFDLLNTALFVSGVHLDQL